MIFFNLFYRYTSQPVNDGFAIPKTDNGTFNAYCTGTAIQNIGILSPS